METISVDLGMTPEQFQELCNSLDEESLRGLALHLKEMVEIINRFGPIAVKTLLMKMMNQLDDTVPDGVTIQ